MRANSIYGENRPVVTGMAWNTAMGNGIEAVWRKIRLGYSGIKSYDFSSNLRNNLAGLLVNIPFEQDCWFRIRKLTKECIISAMKDAQIIGYKKIQLIVGTSLGANLDNPNRYPDSLYKWLVEINYDLGFTLEPILISTSCSSGSDAIALGSEFIKSKSVDICICGGVDILTINKLIAHSELGTMSPTTLKAFDQKHDGSIFGEGAGFLVLINSSNLELIKKNYGYIAGSGSSNDASGFTTPDKTGQSAVLAIKQCLQNANLGDNKIQIINAHGSGTVLNDAVEKEAYNSIFNNKSLPVVYATKGNFGHTLGATGAIEVITLLLAINSGEIPPVYMLSNPISDFKLPLQIGRTRKIELNTGLSLTLGFGGFNTCIAVQK